MGIASCVITAAGVILMIIAMTSKEVKTEITLGIITLGLLGIGAVCAMIAVVNGTAASKAIRKARHPLGGRSEASTGSLTGVIALGLVFAAAITIGIYLAKTGGYIFETTITEPASLFLPL